MQDDQASLFSCLTQREHEILRIIVQGLQQPESSKPAIGPDDSADRQDWKPEPAMPTIAKPESDEH
jgi:hypothetical protein